MPKLRREAVETHRDFTFCNPQLKYENLGHEPQYLGGFKQQIPIPSCDLEGVAVRYAIGADLAVRERLQGLCLSLPIQRHGCSSYAQP